MKTINNEDFAYVSLTELGNLMRQEKVSPTELVSACLQRIERRNPTLNAFITVTAEQALHQAAQADAEIKNGHWKGHLHGIPVGIKDMFDTAGIRTTAAFAAFKDRVPEKDAVVVAKVQAAGAIVIGKLNMHQLAMGTTSVISSFGSVHNPWNTAYMAGGSSGGSAAALAAGLCYATIDTDAIGSCRLPASCCGVTGFKATYGLLSTQGILAGEQADATIIRLSHTAFMSRTVADAALLLNALADSETSHSALKADYRLAFDAAKHPRIGIVKNFKATADVQTAFSDAVTLLRSLGYATSDVDVPFEIPSFDVKNIEHDRQTIAQSLFKDVDVVVLPTTAETTPTIAEAQQREQSKAENAVAFSSHNTFFCNYYGLPAISVPCGFDTNGLPLGLQIVGRQWDEGNVLAVANRYQTATRWHVTYPSFSREQ